MNFSINNFGEILLKNAALMDVRTKGDELSLDLIE